MTTGLSTQRKLQPLTHDSRSSDVRVDRLAAAAAVARPSMDRGAEDRGSATNDRPSIGVERAHQPSRQPIRIVDSFARLRQGPTQTPALGRPWQGATISASTRAIRPPREFESSNESEPNVGAMRMNVLLSTRPQRQCPADFGSSWIGEVWSDEHAVNDMVLEDDVKEIVSTSPGTCCRTLTLKGAASP